MTSTGDNLKTSSLTIGDLYICSETRQVVRRNTPIKGITDKSFQLLWLLARAAPNSLSRDDLMLGVWGKIAVGDDALTQRVKIIRKALGKQSDGREYIQAVHGTGYRLLGESASILQGAGKDDADKTIGKWFIAAFLIFLFYIILSEAGILHLIHKWVN